MNAADILKALVRLCKALVAKGAGVSGLTRLSGGASQETWRFHIIDTDQSEHAFILRRRAEFGPRNDEAITLATEAGLLQHALLGGVCVPKVAYICMPNDGLGDAFIMDFIEGQTVARKILRDDHYRAARSILARHCGTQLAKIHAIPITHNFPALPQSDGMDQLARYEEIYRSFRVNRPIIELSFAWLSKTAPSPSAQTLVHGDFRNGNLIVGEEGLRAVLDWELAHIGDPREDIGWMCVNSWRFGQAQKPVGGFGSLEDLLQAYEAAGGAVFRLADIKWFQALGSLKWAIMCLIMFQAFKTGVDPSIERAMIGRRTSEAEIDLLNLMEGRAFA